MSETATAPIGQILREAREAQGLSVEEAASRLRLMHRQIGAMEDEDFESLGQPVFARGFVRNYARLLGLEPERLLARMAGAPADAMPVCRDAPAPPGRWVTSPWLISLLLGLLLLTAVPVALYWWLNSGEDDGAPAPLRAERRPATLPAAPGADAGRAAAPLPAPIIAQQTAAPPPVRMEESVLRLDFNGESWTEIRDAGGHMLLRQLNLPGAHVELKGQPPFEIVIGNAAQVRLTHNERPIDLAPFVDVNVARFTLEE